MGLAHRAICFLHNKLALVGRETNCCVSVGSPLNNREKPAQRGVCPPNMPVGCDGWPLGSLSAAVTGRTRKWVPKHPRGAVVPAQEIAANQVYILTPVMTAGMLAWNTRYYLTCSLAVWPAWCLQAYELLAGVRDRPADGSGARSPAPSSCLCLIVLRHGKHPPSRARSCSTTNDFSGLRWKMDWEIYLCEKAGEGIQKD